MNKHSDIGKKVDKALESLDGIQRAEPRPFLFTRVKARLEREQTGTWEAVSSFLTRPVVAIAGLFLILAMNVLILAQKDTSNTAGSYRTENAVAQEPESILNMFASNTYDYENIEP